jgi:uncharacterized protein YbjT (DUF2867 family)
MSTVLVIGASRGIGRETVQAALEAGHTVRAMARTRGDLPAEDGGGLTFVAGDARDRADLARAAAGCDVVIQCLGVSLTPDTVLRGTTLFSSATRALVDVIGRTGPRRLIVLTGLGSGDSRGVGPLAYTGLFFPLFLKRIYDDKDVQEQIVRASGLDWTIARPGGLTNGPLTQTYRVLERPAALPSLMISRRDVAHFLVRCLSEPDMIGKALVLVS